MSVGDSTSSSDHVELVKTDKIGQVKQVINTSNLPRALHFCADCGERLKELPLYECELCKTRYAMQYEPQTGKLVIFALGKGEKTE